VSALVSLAAMSLVPMIEASESEELGLADLEVSGLGLVAVLLFAFVLFGVLGGLRWLLGLVPMSKARRAALSRFRPVFEALVTVIYLLIAVPIVFKGHDEFTPLVLAVLLFGLIAISWAAIRDFVNGMFIKAGELCEPGDYVEVDDKAGVVKRLGYRVLTLETDEGAEVFIPYGRLSRRSMVRTPRAEGVYRHGFEIELPPELDPVVGVTRVKQLAMSSHWSSVVREPEVEPLAGGALQVRVFALGREHGPAIEAVIRRGLRESV
jgi:small-conductance mechanosensitive channel